MLHLEHEGNAALVAMLCACEMIVTGVHRYDYLFICFLCMQVRCVFELLQQCRKTMESQWGSAGYLVNKAMETGKQKYYRSTEVVPIEWGV